MKEHEQGLLEAMVDKYSLAHVLHALDAICEQKRDHIEVSYGDANLAQHWHRAGTRIRKCAEGKAVQHVCSDTYRAATGA